MEYYGFESVLYRDMIPKDVNYSVFGLKFIKNAFKTACRKAEIKNFKFRDCRHTTTTRMVNSGIP